MVVDVRREEVKGEDEEEVEEVIVVARYEAKGKEVEASVARDEDETADAVMEDSERDAEGIPDDF